MTPMIWQELAKAIYDEIKLGPFRDDLLHLKRLGMIGLRGRGRGATWFIVRDSQRE